MKELEVIGAIGRRGRVVIVPLLVGTKSHSGFNFAEYGSHAYRMQHVRATLVEIMAHAGIVVRTLPDKASGRPTGHYLGSDDLGDVSDLLFEQLRERAWPLTAAHWRPPHDNEVAPLVTVNGNPLYNLDTELPADQGYLRLSAAFGDDADSLVG